MSNIHNDTIKEKIYEQVLEDLAPLDWFTNLSKEEFEKVVEVIQGMVPPTEFKGSKFIFPVCSFEEDLPDEPMSFYLNSPDENFNQDVSCYVDKLFASDEYNLIFGKMINVKKIPSLLSVYSYTNFLNAIGLDKDEREDSDESQINSNNMGRIFNDTKKELKKLFIETYRRSDFDPPDDDNREDQATKSKNKKLQSTLDHVVMSKEIPWFSKLNKVFDNPLVGLVFGNAYSKMFDLVETEER